MTPLRLRMIEDMQIRNLAPLTQSAYLEVSLFARHFGQSPERLGREDIRAYRSIWRRTNTWRPARSRSRWPRCASLTVTFKQAWTVKADIPACGFPRNSPGAAPERSQPVPGRSREPEAPRDPDCLYAAGLRVSEAVRLKPAAIDSRRMVIRVEEGKGRKDRYRDAVAELVDILRDYLESRSPDPVAVPPVTGLAARSQGLLSNASARRRVSDLTSPSRSRRIPCVTPSPSICSSPVPICAPSSCCSVIAV